METMSNTPMSQPEPPPNARLYTKLANITQRMQRIPKNGRNEFFKYDFATEGDIVEAVSTAMAEENLAILPEMVSYTHENNGKSNYTICEFQFTFACGDTGATLTRRWFNEALDNGDKGFNKATTAALKYFLMKTFLISTGEPDEHETGTTESNAKQNQRKPIGIKPPQRTHGQQSPQRPEPEPPPATSNGHKEPEPNGKVHEKAEDKQEWPNAGAINHVIKYSCQQLSITEADVARYLDIKELADVESWKKFTNGGEAMKAIKAGFDADTEALAKLPPAQPKTSPFGGTAETAKRHEWTDKDRADMDALCARFWDEELVAPLLPDKFFADTDHVAWSAFPSIAAARAALIAYAREHQLPIIVSSAEHAAKHKYTTFSNDLLQVTLYSRDKLRKLGTDWKEYVDKDWSEAGGRYQFSRKGLPDLIVHWQAKIAKDGHEYLDCVDVAEVESEATPD